MRSVFSHATRIEFTQRIMLSSDANVFKTRVLDERFGLYVALGRANPVSAVELTEGGHLLDLRLLPLFEGRNVRLRHVLGTFIYGTSHNRRSITPNVEVDELPTRSLFYYHAENAAQFVDMHLR